MDGDDGHVPVGGAPPGPGPSPGPAAPLVLLPAVEPLQVFGDIEAAVNAIAVDDPAPMINILEVMFARLNTLTMDQKLRGACVVSFLRVFLHMEPHHVT